jgi:hypothetical protein
MPTRKEIQFVPGALAMSKENQGAGHG